MNSKTILCTCKSFSWLSRLELCCLLLLLQQRHSCVWQFSPSWPEAYLVSHYRPFHIKTRIVTTGWAMLFGFDPSLIRNPPKVVWIMMLMICRPIDRHHHWRNCSWFTVNMVRWISRILPSPFVEQTFGSERISGVNVPTSGDVTSPWKLRCKIFIVNNKHQHRSSFRQTLKKSRQKKIHWIGQRAQDFSTANQPMEIK